MTSATARVAPRRRTCPTTWRSSLLTSCFRPVWAPACASPTMQRARSSTRTQPSSRSGAAASLLNWHQRSRTAATHRFGGCGTCRRRAPPRQNTMQRTPPRPRGHRQRGRRSSTPCRCWPRSPPWSCAFRPLAPISRPSCCRACRGCAAWRSRWSAAMPEMAAIWGCSSWQLPRSCPPWLTCQSSGPPALWDCGLRSSLGSGRG